MTDQQQQLPNRRGRPYPPFEERFMSRVVETDLGCWEWTGSRMKTGYGTTSKDGKGMLAHRASYEHFVGPIATGMEIDHLCRNRWCVKPNHLEQVTHRVNSLRGQTITAEHASRTHCPRGHEYTPENTDVRPQSMGRPGMARFCRTCSREHSREAVRVGVACDGCGWRGKRAPGSEGNPCPKCDSDLRVPARKEAA